jgi:hypothetical protein
MAKEKLTKNLEVVDVDYLRESSVSDVDPGSARGHGFF